MSLHNFLNPADEDIMLDDAPTLDEIIEEHTGQIVEDEEAILEDIKLSSVEILSTKEAMLAVQTLLQYQECQEQAKIEEI